MYIKIDNACTHIFIHTYVSENIYLYKYIDLWLFFFYWTFLFAKKAYYACLFLDLQAYLPIKGLIESDKNHNSLIKVSQGQ